jgi:hypothetical protein
MYSDMVRLGYELQGMKGMRQQAVAGQQSDSEEIGWFSIRRCRRVLLGQ